MAHVYPLDRADRQSYEIMKIQGPDSHTFLGQTYDISYDNIFDGQHGQEGQHAPSYQIS